MRAMSIDSGFPTGQRGGLELTGIQSQWIIGRVVDAAGLCGRSADLGAWGY